MILSVVIVIASDTVRRPGRVDHLRHCLRALRAQEGAGALDIVVPHLPAVAGIAALGREFPDVRFIAAAAVERTMPGGWWRDHHDQLRAIGVAAARGDIVAMLEDHEFPDSHWAARVSAAHAAANYAAIGGAVENSVGRPLNWAVFFCDFARYLNPIRSGPSPIATDVNVSYTREALDAIASVWQARFHERRVHAALLARGFVLALSPAIVVHQHRVDLTPGAAIAERFVWGRSYAATRCERWSIGRRVLYGLLSPLLPFVLSVRITAAVAGKRRKLFEFVRALPWIAVLATVWSAGEMVGYFTVRGIPLAVREHVAERA